MPKKKARMGTEYYLCSGSGNKTELGHECAAELEVETVSSSIITLRAIDYVNFTTISV